jgi:plasmid stability protein
MSDQDKPASGIQIKVWLPEGFYDLLRARAARHRTSVAEEARRLMRLGLAGAEELDALADRLGRLDAFAREHLEPLAWLAAMAAAQDLEIQVEAMRHKAAAQPGADVPALLERALAPTRQRAVERVRQVLRLGHEALEEAERDGEGPDAQDDRP